MHTVKTLSENLKRKREGVSINSITGDDVQLVYIKPEASFTSNHSHPNEQLGYILSGELELTVGTECIHSKTGDAYHIPANVEHGFRVLSQSLEYIEVFSPVKQENII
jgi:quercetin dioxygenase-like cupin family protein